jgi:hypothetical protein
MDETEKATWERRWLALEKAIVDQIANEPYAELAYQATRAYWVTRGLAERDEGMTAEQAHEKGKRAAVELIEQARRRGIRPR